MGKRQFLTTSAAVGAVALINPLFKPAWAQSTPRPGKDYRLVNPPQRTEAPAGKIEVVEFFWVGCPHCRSLEPVIMDWKKKQADDVFFRKVHVNFRFPTHQQLYYTLVTLGKDEELLPSVFAEIHDKKNRLTKPDQVFDWAQAQGLDREEFVKVYRSFGVRTQMRRASQQVKDFGVSGVPALVVNGKYYTAPSMAGSNGAAMFVVDAFIAKERKGG